MKPILNCILAGVLVFTVFQENAVAGDSEARAVMLKVDARDDGDRLIADMKMLLIDEDGKQRTREIRSFSIDRGEDRLSLMFFLSPANVKSTGFLTYDYEKADKDDDQWLFLPALKKTKRLVSSDKSGSFMGSDFTYADMTKRRLDDYTYEFNKKQKEATIYGKKVLVIDCIPHNPDVMEETGYTKSIVFVRLDNHMVARAIHFVRDGGYVKYFDVKRMERIDNIWTNLEIHMTTKKGSETVHKTILALNNVRYNQEAITEKMFTVRRLEKGL